jgi:hypothetical protein
VDGVEGNALEISAVVARRLNSSERELGGNVFGGQLPAAGAGTAAFEQIEREEADMGTNLLRIDGDGGGASGRGQAGDCRD